MKLKKFVKPLCLILVVIVVIFICSNNSVFAEINPDYTKGATAPTANLDNIVKNDALSNAVGQLIYTVGNLLEKLFTLIILAVSGTPAFPWSDKIIFNAVPLLDINFINPNVNSLFGSAGGLQGLIRNVYFTVLSLSITFFGIGVVLMAIKLVTTAIAEEKAKYNEAIMNWLIGLTLLFTIHYGISFIFYLNESLVQVASGIVKDQLKDSDVAKGLEVDNTYKAKVVVNFLNSQMDVGDSWMNFGSEVGAWSQAAVDALFGNLNWAKSDLDNSEKNQATEASKYILSPDNINFAYYLISDDNAKKTLGEIKDIDLNKTPGGDKFGQYAQAFIPFATGSSSFKNIIAVAQFMNYVNTTTPAMLPGINSQIKNGTDFEKTREKFRLQCYNYFVSKTSSSDATTVNIIQDLGDYFKGAAFYADVSNGQWKKNTASIQNAIMYTILVVQSILYFFAYIKRLFYVIILALMAPVMIVYNFFVKSISGGGKNDVFGNWIKEFCVIVFTQTLQAFIFAIIIVIIIKANANAGVNGVTEPQDKNAGVALIGIVALASLGKIEDLVKDMLGFKSSIHDSSMRGGMKSLMAGMAIGGAVKNRVFSNAGKLKNGISEAWSSGKARKAEENRYNKKLALYGFGSEGSNNGQNSPNNGNPSKTEDLVSKEYQDKAHEADANEATAAGAQNDKKAIAEQQKLNQRQFSLADRVKLDDLRNAHEDRLSEIKKKKHEGWKKIASSGIETIGATGGAIAGASLGLGTGDIKDAIAAAGVGSIAGDWAGEQAVNLSNFTKDRVNDINSYVEKRKKTTAKQIKDNRQMFEKRKAELNDILDKLPKDVSDIY